MKEITLESRPRRRREPTQSFFLVGVVWQKLSAMASHRQRTFLFEVSAKQNKAARWQSRGKVRQKRVCSRISVDGDLEISSSSPNLHPVEPVFFPIRG